MPPIDPEPVELEAHGIANGGAAVARDEGGRVVFVEGALPGERVRVELTEQRSSFARGRVVEVLTAAPGRVEPVCPEVGTGCGGCDLAYATHGTQLDLKAQMVADALARIGHVAAPTVGHGPPLAPTGFRTTIRAAVVGGRAGLRRARSNDVVEVRSCRVAHPTVEELLVEGRYGDADEITIRVGARTGERMVVTDGDPSTVVVPDDVVVVGADGPVAHVHEVVAGHRFRISPRSFFQTRADGADALVATVTSAVSGSSTPGSPGTLVDLCCGVGLFAATVGGSAGRVVAVESNRAAVADARHNLAALGDRVDVVGSTFERWTPVPADVVVADPSRAGLGRAGVSNVLATGAPLVVLVSCDAGSLGRDAGLLVAAGLTLDEVTLVDMFPDTSHVEVVSVFRRGGAPS
ncbi:MAG: TRAM domain-containing protein [Acidimicrobiales bacterium]